MSLDRLRHMPAATLFRLALITALTECVLIAVLTLRGAPGGALNDAPVNAPLYAGLLWALLKCTPLLLILPGLARRRANAAIWLCFLSCAYFTTAVLAAMDPARRGLGLVEIAVLATAFTAGLLAARKAGRGESSLETP